MIEFVRKDLFILTLMAFTIFSFLGVVFYCEYQDYLEEKEEENKIKKKGHLSKKKKQKA